MVTSSVIIVSHVCIFIVLLLICPPTTNPDIINLRTLEVGEYTVHVLSDLVNPDISVPGVFCPD